MDNDKSATPAPTLEALPPEKGTILELHSIGKQGWDGLLVEFDRLDKSSGGKCYFVVPIHGKDGEGRETEGLRVNSKCCRRPDIKPYKLRKTLADLTVALGLKDTAKDCMFGVKSAVEADLKKLLEKDPCLVPVYISLALREHHTMTTDTLKDENFNTTIGYDESNNRFIQYSRRAIANTYAYADFWGDAVLNFSVRQLADALIRSGKPQEALRLSRAPKAGTKSFPPICAARDKQTSADALFAIGANFCKKNQYPKCYRALSESAQHYAECLTILVTVENKTREVNTFAQHCLDHTEKILLALGARIDNLKSLQFKIVNGLTTTPGREETNAEALRCCEIIVQAVTCAYKAWTAKDGSFQFFSRNHFASFNKSKSAAEDIVNDKGFNVVYMRLK